MHFLTVSVTMMKLPFDKREIDQTDGDARISVSDFIFCAHSTASVRSKSAKLYLVTFSVCLNWKWTENESERRQVTTFLIKTLFIYGIFRFVWVLLNRNWKYKVWGGVAMCVCGGANDVFIERRRIITKIWHSREPFSIHMRAKRRAGGQNMLFIPNAHEI